MPLHPLPLLRLLLSSLWLTANTLLWCWPLFALALLRLLPLPATAQRLLRQLMGGIATAWIAGNSAWLHGLCRGRWRVRGLEQLSGLGSCLVVSNHQSWVDILVLQGVLNRRLPMLRFFLKRELIWLPVIGLCCWALDFPFMRRRSKAWLARHPERHGEDLATTRRACQRLQGVPVAIFNFAEGTRFSAPKHAAQPSPYQHLLRPRAGGLALAIDAMGEQLQALVDITLFYPDGQPRFIDLLSGRLRRVWVEIEVRPIPAEFLGRSYTEDEAYRLQFQHWLNALWAAKDLRLTALHAQRDEDREAVTRA
ncbi:acyltransferase [Pseudomonas sp. NW5]|uniref:acyltransferase n=1 Tax=Pseudomonas sp. NW5 TaxID=2934934 RepID=UPI002021E295|nr:acyltransferase [Pseudomonas sp. NW5]MCL7461772.1 acyltransferase [Pseudomonas sp. NW5]